MATNETTVHFAHPHEIPFDKLITNPLYPPDRLDDEGLAELRAVIEESRIIIPPDVMPVPEGYVVRDGHRRIAVARRLGFQALRCSIVPPYTDRIRRFGTHSGKPALQRSGDLRR